MICEHFLGKPQLSSIYTVYLLEVRNQIGISHEHVDHVEIC